MGKVQPNGDIVTYSLNIFGFGLTIFAYEERRTLTLGPEVGGLALPSVVTEAGVRNVLSL